MYVQRLVSFKFQRQQINVVINHHCYDTMTLNPNNETELHGIAAVLLCDELTVWRDAYVMSWPVPSWPCDDMTAWRDDRVTSWLVARLGQVYWRWRRLIALPAIACGLLRFSGGPEPNKLFYYYSTRFDYLWPLIPHRTDVIITQQLTCNISCALATAICALTCSMSSSFFDESSLEPELGKLDEKSDISNVLTLTDNFSINNFRLINFCKSRLQIEITDRRGRAVMPKPTEFSLGNRIIIFISSSREDIIIALRSAFNRWRYRRRG